jgi:uridine phosphorylase
VISAGFGGALQPGYSVGDIILATDVINEEGARWRVSWPTHVSDGAQARLSRNSVLTASQIIGTPEEKRRLGSLHNAVAVDMESTIVAQHCDKHGVPFGCVKVISDDVDTALSPRLVSLVERGHVPKLRMAAALAREPRLVPQIWHLSKNTRIAAARLATMLDSLLNPEGVESLSPGSQERTLDRLHGL